jgi:hypothetical protein
MAFETFTGGRTVTKEPRVSLLKQGNFNFNSGSMKILKEQAVTHLQLLFDKETNRIAFKPCRKTDQGAFKLREIKGLGQVSGVAFLKTYSIPFGTETISYPAVWNTEQQMLIINLG